MQLKHIVGWIACLLLITCYAKSPSKMPAISADIMQSSAAPYVSEFSQSDRLYEQRAGSNVSPNGRWRVIIKRENSNDDIAGFYSLSMEETDSGNVHTLFTFWDADVGSGYRLSVRWSNESKAIQLKGDTRGFSYSNDSNLEYESFNFVYLVEDKRLFSMPTNGA